MGPIVESAAGPGRTSPLLEREHELARLEGYLDVIASTGIGVGVLVEGEAGAGKTALMSELRDRRAPLVRSLWGACEHLLAPRPFGPFIDVTGAIDGESRKMIDSGARPHAVAMSLIDELSDIDEPCLVVLEDLQWADEATLDVLRMLTRRIASADALLAVTYRNDELGRWHPLRVLIGELRANQEIPRISLAPLSLDAVVTLAASMNVDPVALHARTDGNPFFVCEVLEAGGGQLPRTVADAVLARAARLSPGARKLLETIAVLGNEVELWLLERICPRVGDELEECMQGGMLESSGRAVRFRHELARDAILGAMGDHEKTSVHVAALDALADPPWAEPDLARLAHHADGAGDPEAIQRYVPSAAARAVKLGAHREAAALYGRALSFADAMPLAKRAELLERRAGECYLLTEFEAAEAAQRQALACYRQLDNEVRRAAAMSWLAELVWQVGSLGDALPMAREAVTELERLGAGRELVGAICRVAQLSLAAEDPDEARIWGARAYQLAREIGKPRTIAGALMTLGWSEFFTGEASGLEKLEQCIESAEGVGEGTIVIGAHVVIARTAARLRMYELAAEHTQVGLAYCDGRDIDLWRYYLIAWQSKLSLWRANWDQASTLAGICLNEPCPFARIHALVALGLTRARRGDPDPWMPLDEALSIALPRREFQWIAPVAGARAEAAWLEGRRGEILTNLQPAFGFPVRRSDPYATTLSYWRWRAGVDPELPPGTGGDPYVAEIEGDWERAASQWRELGCPYEAALALAASDDPNILRQSLAELQALDARPGAAVLARTLRERGIRGIPRGPRRGTRQNPAGLTARELDVVALLAEGLRNAEIASRLVVSEKTVDHHVSAILRKLDVHTRGEATAEAARLGLTLPT